jgi:hypothetical protein
MTSCLILIYVHSKRNREHELRVAAEMERWATEQLSSFSNDARNGAVEAVQSAIV